MLGLVGSGTEANLQCTSDVQLVDTMTSFGACQLQMVGTILNRGVSANWGVAVATQLETWL